MKNTYNFLIPVVLLLLSLEVQAQFEAGQSFVSGNFSTNIASFKSEATQPSENYFYYNFGVSWGQFTKSNRAAGWGLNSSLAKYTNDRLNTPSFQELSLGGSRFVEFYKPIAEKLALYLIPSVGLTYSQENTPNGQTIINQTNTLILGASLSAGIAWRITPKWALYGSLAFANPISISAGVSNKKNYDRSTPKNSTVESRGSVFDYSFAPSLNRAC